MTEWPASEKANLEVLLRNGAVAVAYSGCSMRVLAECRVKGEYHWQRTTPASDSLEINDSDELYAKLPLGAASLEGELKRSGKLAVQTMISGQLRLDTVAVADVPREGPCAQATHIVSGLSLGAFALKGGGKREGSAGVNVTAIGEAKAKREQSADLLRSAGDFDSCAASTAESPHANCASPIQAFLAPLPGRTEEEGPPGTVKVDFVSGDAASRWDVYADDVVICTTPCARYVNAERPVMLRAREEAFMGSPDKVRVTNLLAHGGGHLQLQAHGTARGQLATGITLHGADRDGRDHRHHAVQRRLLQQRRARLLHAGVDHAGHHGAAARGQHLADHRFDAARRGRLARRRPDPARAPEQADRRLRPRFRLRRLLIRRFWQWPVTAARVSP